MSSQRTLGIAFVVAGLFLAGCEQILHTGKVGNTKNAPSPDGTCPAGLSACGTGTFAQCLDLQNDHAHCGACDNACALGIACAAGDCQQVACTGPVTVSSQTLPTGTNPTIPIRGAILADVNGDGRPDLVTWDYSGTIPGTFEVALGQAGGGFAAPATYQTANGVDYITVADSNGDGFDDLYVSDPYDSPCLQLWLGHADGKLTPSADLGDAGCTSPVVVADLNGDGILDMVAYNPVEAAAPAVFLADAQGRFHVGTPLSVKHNAIAFLVRDWNGDGLPDLVNVAYDLSVFLNQGNGNFAEEMDCGVLTGRSEQAVVADFNHDGYLDVAADIIEKGIGVLLGMGGCQFQPMVEYPLSGAVVALVQGDLDGDGIGDLVARTSDGNVSLLRGAADGSFEVSALASSVSCDVWCPLLVGDVTNDGKVDVVVEGGSGVSSSGDQSTLVVQPTQILGNACP